MNGLDNVYMYAVFGVSWALVKDKDGTVRDATPAELKKISERFDKEMKPSFSVPK